MKFSQMIRSKTFWLGVLGVGWGIYQLVTGHGDEGIQEIGAGLGLIFVRQAIGKAAEGESV